MLLSSMANALVVNVNGYGMIPDEGLTIAVREAREDALTGRMQMRLDGTVESAGALTVEIRRSRAGLRDEFCCADRCQAGNGEREEELHFAHSGSASWFAHYEPEGDSEETVVYTFTGDGETRVLTVRYQYSLTDMDAIYTYEGTSALPYSVCYTLTGVPVSDKRSARGICIQKGKKTLY